jgi:hypothetical protein
LRDFLNTALPSKCSIKSTNIHSLYHEKKLGGEQAIQVLEEFHQRKLRFPLRRDLIVPLLSTVDGARVMPANDNDPDGLLKDILHMTLAAPTDWVAVQQSILSMADEVMSDGSKFSVYNYGPGYGALNASEYAQSEVEVRSVAEWSGPERSSEDDIAIVGVGIDLPDAPDLEALWRNLMSQKNSSSEVISCTPFIAYSWSTH